jgi:Ca2+-binding RTX toxin-like protein
MVTNLLITDPSIFDVPQVFLVGTNGNDNGNSVDLPTLIGGKGSDLILGLDGDDSLLGRQGNDTLRGGNGNDTLIGEGGDDILIGEAGRDILFGGLGNDLLDGGDGYDTLKGGFGNDTLFGGTGKDSLEANQNKDLLFGQIGDDTLSGGMDNDILVGGSGRDSLVGGRGNDTLIGGDAKFDSRNGKPNADGFDLDRDIFVFSNIDSLQKSTLKTTEVKDALGNIISSNTTKQMNIDVIEGFDVNKDVIELRFNFSKELMDSTSQYYDFLNAMNQGLQSAFFQIGADTYIGSRPELGYGFGTFTGGANLNESYILLKNVNIDDLGQANFIFVDIN